MTALNIGASMNSSVDNKFRDVKIDVIFSFSKPYPDQVLQKSVLMVPGVRDMESWGGAKASRIRMDGTEGNRFSVFGIPEGSKLFAKLPVVQGRWLEPGDSKAVVLNHALLAPESEPDIKAGDTVTLKINGRNTDWYVAGIVREIMTPPRAYVLNEALSSITGQDGYSGIAAISAVNRDVRQVSRLTQSLESNFAAQGMDVEGSIKLREMRKIIEDHLVLIASLLITMSVMVMIVGGMGLVSTMSMNVMERTREIGIMRASGASSLTLTGIIVTEGILIGFISWIIAVVISYPISILASTQFGMIFFETPLNFAVSFAGIAVWFGVVIVFSTAASLYPAWKAVRLSVREVLVYE